MVCPIIILQYNFFAAEAILSLSFVNGWATPIRSMHRKYVHIFLQLCTITTAASGMIIVARNKELQSTAHSASGNHCTNDCVCM